MSPLVSVIIPVFNRLPFLREAVESCLAQTYENIEVIIVDDGSTDESCDFLAGPLPATWRSRVRCYRQDNAGASAARNEGLRRASGAYIQFLDSDDLLLEDKIRLQVGELESSSSSHEVCSCYGRLQQGGDAAIGVRRIGVRCNTPAEYVRRMCGQTIHGMPTCGPLWNRNLLDGNNGWSIDISLGDDLEYYVRLLTRVARVEFVDCELFIVREHDGPRLSRAAGDRQRVISAFTAHRRIVDTVRGAGLCDEMTEHGLSRKARTLYANLLGMGESEDVEYFESWLRSSWRGRRGGGALALAMLSRQLVGQRTTSALIGGLVRARQVIAG